MTKEEFDLQLKILIKESRHDEISILKKKRSDYFWKTEYSMKDDDEKIQFWSSQIYMSMRRHGETGGRPMDIFSKKDYYFWKQKEPHFDNLFPKILDNMKINKSLVYKSLDQSKDYP